MLNINVSSKHENQLQQLAALENEDIESLAAKLLEEKIEQIFDQKVEVEKAAEAPVDNRKFMRMKGMFNSGNTDTARRAKEILRTEIGRNGFGDFGD